MALNLYKLVFLLLVVLFCGMLDTVEWLPFIVKNLAEIFFVVAGTWRYLTTDGQVLEVLYYAVLRQCVMLCDVMIQCVLL